MDTLIPGVYREQSLISNVSKFYNNKKNLDKFLPIVQGTDISLRIIDWYVTNYTRYNRTNIRVNGKDIDIWSEYKSQLKSYKKEAFDAFCRLDPNKKTGVTKKLINFRYGKGEDDEIPTTIGQLNFFKWVISSGILDYIKENKENIEKLMCDEENKKKLKVKSKGKKGKKEEISVEMNKEKINVKLEDLSTKRKEQIIVTFD